VPRLAVVGNLSRDLVDAGPPRVGGAPFWAARALRVLEAPALVAVKCADADRAEFARPLVALGIPVLWLGGTSTATFRFADGDRREMTVEALRSSGRRRMCRGRRGAGSRGRVGAIDFPRDAGGARGEQAPPAARRPGGRSSAADRADRRDGPEFLRHVAVLKLSEDEARALVGEPDETALRALGVPEVVVTLGSKGSLVWFEGRLERVAAQPVAGPIDPTGAGDAFAVAYVASRAGGHAPVASARRAGALVTGLLARRLR
jgi:sugar/nucleoside kinase (ribokinase family)